MQAETARRRAYDRAETRPSPARLGWLIQVLCLLYAALVVVEDVQDLLWRTALTPEAGTIGASADPAGGGYVVVKDVAPGGPMARAGVVAGDRTRFDRTWDYLRHIGTGETTGFTLVRAGRTVHVEVAGQARAFPSTSGQQLGLVYALADMTAALFGTFLLWRSRRVATTMLLGMALVAFGMASIGAASGPVLFPFVYAQGIANQAAVPLLFYAFASRFYRDCVGPSKPYERAAFLVYTLAGVFAGTVYAVSHLNAIVFPVVGDGAVMGVGLSYLGFAVCLAYLVLGWRRSARALQQRYALLLVAASTIMLAQTLDLVFILPLSPPAPVKAAYLLANTILIGLIAPGLFTYAILRHRVFDVGFAVNRTLVYGVVSAVLLAGFGLIEWAVDHFAPIEGREKNALVDAAIALGVFLAFHRVRDAVEHGVESLFFRRWQQAEAALRRFVSEAAFITERAALTQALVPALSRFAEGAQAAVYLREGRGYARVDGDVAGFAGQLEVDLPALVSVRADPKPMEVLDGGQGGALIAPMVNRNEVVGLMLLGPKPSGRGWRPDEIELIGWAARQVGLDLHALKVERLEADTADLRKTVAVLERALALRPATV